MSAPEIRDALAYLRVDQLAGRRPRLRAHRQRAEARARRRDGPGCCTTTPAGARIPLFDAARACDRDRRAEARRHAAACASVIENVRPLAQPGDRAAFTPSSPKSFSTRAVTPRCGRRTVLADAQGRLDNLKELVRSMEEFENLQGFLEHIALVMDREDGALDDAVFGVMTLHSAKGLEFDTVFLPGWEEGLFPSQRTLDDQGRAGLGGRAPPRPCRPDPRTPSRKNLFRHQPPHSRHLVDQQSPRASSTTCPAPMSRSRS